MRHLKKFNEDNNIECDFDTFKDILYTITDNYNDDIIFEENENDYVCCIEIGDYIELKSIFISSLRYNNDSYTTFDLSVFNEKINKKTDELGKIKKELDNIISKNIEIKKVVLDTHNRILPIFQNFSNFDKLDISIDDYVIICFMKK